MTAMAILNTDMWMRVLAHECRHYLSLTELMIQRQKLLGAGEALAEDVAHAMQEHIRHASLLLNEVVSLAREEHIQSFVLENITLNSWLQSFITPWLPIIHAQNSHIHMDICNSANIQANTMIMKSALTNLLSNILRHNKRCDGCDISIQAHSQDNKVNVTIKDNGEGFPEAVLHDWKKNKPIPDNDTLNGMGLPLTATMLQSMGATMDIGNHSSGGANVTLLFKPSHSATA